ncbi:histidine phosphatase family protein [Shewanella sp. VB17]|uniref:histidine phosphatase family protein n=1 Tax=Shewanella sp. VB17 TaxID=2739432 RepID=UPI0015677DD0|nr:histidine phosphatase family protein [Shewanella sp. VB17]NRD73006.1 histidine phosphatase family protein [Shewanella sp. VB17]
MENNDTHDWSNGVTTTFYLMLNGECVGGEILRGQTDTALSQLGIEQMKKAMTGIDIQFNQLICSPLRRCSEFALKLYLEQGIPLKMEEGFKEIDFGDWDGETLESLYEEHSGVLDMYRKNPWAFTPPNGETMQAFEARVNQSWEHILSQYSGQSLLVLTHAGVIRHLISSALGVTGAVGFYTHLALASASVVKITVCTDAQGVHFSTLHWGVSDDVAHVL